MISTQKTQIENIFKDAFFWFNKGYKIQTNVSTKTNDEEQNDSNKDTVAFDYYLSGVKIDPFHIGCIHNAACCHYFTGKFANAEKWFSIAIKVDPHNQDSYIGKTVACLKLGKFKEAHETIA